MKRYIYSYLIAGLLIFNFCGAMQQEPEIMPVPQVAEQPMAETPTSSGQFVDVGALLDTEIKEKVEKFVQENGQLIPGFKKEVLLGEVAPQYQEMIISALTELQGVAKKLSSKNYTLEVVPFCLKTCVREIVFEKKDVQELIGFMNATWMVGLPYLANAAASLFVESQLPTTIAQKGFSKVKQLFCMGTIDPDDLMEKAVDMGIKKEIADMYIKKHVAMYKKYFAYDECTAADWVLLAEILEKDPTAVSFQVKGIALPSFMVSKGVQGLKDLRAKGIMLLVGLSSLDGMDLLADYTDITVLGILTYKGDAIKAHTFKSMSHLKGLVISAPLSRDITIEDNAFAGLSNLDSLVIDNSSFKAGTWTNWFLTAAGERGILHLNLRKEMFAGLDQLTLLEIKHVHIPYLKPGVFDAMRKLQVLKLEHTGLSTIEANTFKNMPELANLYLNDNDIQSINDRAFDGLSKLTLLSLQNNNLAFVHAGQFKDLKKIGFLDLRGNPVSEEVLTKFRKGLRRGCYLAVDFENLMNRKGIFSLPRRTELNKLNQELMRAEEGE